VIKLTGTLEKKPAWNGWDRAEIVPLTIERYGQNYTINIGRNISVVNLTIEKKHQLTESLRDAIATLKWEIWERQPKTKWAEIPTDYRLQELQVQMNNVYTIDDIEVTRFHTKAEMVQKDVDTIMDKLVPCKENVFLFRKWEKLTHKTIVRIITMVSCVFFRLWVFLQMDLLD